MLELRIPNTAFEPEAILEGSVAWSFADQVDAIEIRLIWYTEGKGTQDVTVFETYRCATRNGGEEKFSFVLPAFPLSFSGQLVSLRWAVEAVCKPSNENTRHELVIGPNGREIKLPSTPENSLKSRAAVRLRDRRGRDA